MRTVFVALMSVVLFCMGGLGVIAAQEGYVPYKVMSPPTTDRVKLVVKFMPQEEVEMYCGPRAEGCYLKNVAGYDDWLVMIPIKDFNDERSLFILGHEIFHALGAEHD